jgi:hypothetical protein
VNYQIVLKNPGASVYAPLWIGTRLSILEGQSPYSEETLAASQSLMRREGLDVGETDPGWFLYPFFSILLFTPTALIPDFNLASAVWMTLLAGSLVAIAFTSLELTRWRPSRIVLGAYLLFFIGGYYAIRPVYLGNPSVLAALFIVLAFLLIQRERDIAAGILLGLATLKPQVVILLWCFVLLWGVSRRRLALVSSLILTPLGLAVISSRIQPGWLKANLTLMAKYIMQSGPYNFGGIFEIWWGDNGDSIAWIFTLGLSILLITEWWRALGKDLRWFLWTSGLTLVITNMIGFPTATSNHIVLIPILTLVISILDQRSVGFGRYFIIFVMLAVFGGMWGLYVKTAEGGPGLQQDPIMLVPLPVLLFFMLYWIKYWALNSLRLPVEKLEALKNL